jgi:hypothetical protein
MNAKQVQALRNQINAAHAAGNSTKAAALQAKLHAHFVAQSDAFVNSAEGRKHMDRLMERA